MRNRNWDRDFDEINQSNVNRFHTTRSGERQYDSGYSNPMGQTSFERHMQRYEDDRFVPGANTSRDRYSPDARGERHYGEHRHTRADYDERVHLRNRHPDENATGRGFFGRIGEHMGHFIEEGRERVQHMFDRFGNQHPEQQHMQHRGYGHRHEDNPYQGRYREQHDQRGQHQARHDRQQDQDTREWRNSPHYQGNQGHVMNHRYQSNDYSARSSYRLLDSNSGYGQGGYSYASDQDSD